MNDVRWARIFWVAEHLGGVFYQRFSTHVPNQDVGGVFLCFAEHEHDHARWYGEWLQARGHALPSGASYQALVLPGVQMWLAPQSLDRKLRTFSATERTAARHLRSLANKVQDPELKSIIEKTIPFEDMHAEWYAKEGHRMLKPREEG